MRCVRSVVIAVMTLAGSTTPGCIVSGPWQRGDHVSPRTDPTEDVGSWTSKVVAAAAAWQTALGTDCSFPFHITLIDEADDDGHPITLVPITKWAWAPDTDGEEWTDGIDIKSGQSDYSLHACIIHELGHALGLQHSADPTSIMFASVTVTHVPSSEDARDARNALGCPSQ